MARRLSASDRGRTRLRPDRGNFRVVEGSNREEPGGAEAPARSDRGRILLALGALAAFGVVVAVVAVTAGGSGDSGGAGAEPPQECIDAWNQDRAALAFARHNSIFHNYSSAEVGYLTPAADASVSSEAETGECVVVFARNQLDPEALAAGQILEGGVWTPLTDVTDVNTVARLQSEAFDGANAKPTIDGEIVPKD
jgi:hypothetical protein